MKRLKTLELWESVKKNKGADCEKRPTVIEELKCVLVFKWVCRRLNRRNHSLLQQKVLLATESKACQSIASASACTTVRTSSHMFFMYHLALFNFLPDKCVKNRAQKCAQLPNSSTTRGSYTGVELA